MKTKIFSVFDTKAMVYGVPFFMTTVGAAVRAFQDVANDPNTTINRHPADFILYEIGSFDDADASLTMTMPRAELGHASDFVKPRLQLRDDIKVHQEIHENMMMKENPEA